VTIPVNAPAASGATSGVITGAIFIIIKFYVNVK
jgi:hypothetical protein